MKKRLHAAITCFVFIVVLTCVVAIWQGIFGQRGYAIEINGEETEFTSVISDDTHYVPMRIVFEKMGAQIFYRSSDRCIIALTREGNIITHTAGDNVITVNGMQKTLNNPSFIEEDETYIPIAMVSIAFTPNGISYDNKILNIQKQVPDTYYHKAVKDILDVCRKRDFNPENFKRYIDYHAKMPDYTTDEVVFKVNHGLDYPFYENITTIENPDDLLVLVNKYNKLPSDYKQKNLVEMNMEYTVNDGKEYLLSDIAYEKYVQMTETAKDEGLTLKVVSAYRTEAYQSGLYNNKVISAGKTHADNYSARPGHSEHQTGLAVDINSTSGTFEHTAEFRWLKTHAHEYGFILRYPKGKEYITGYSYEPWHYRYVGEDVAKIVYEEDITYEEYYVKYISANEFK